MQSKICFKKIAISDYKLGIADIKETVEQQDETEIMVFIKSKQHLLGEIRGSTVPIPLPMRFRTCEPVKSQPSNYKITGWIKYMWAPYKGYQDSYRWYQFIGFCHQVAPSGINGNIKVAYRPEDIDLYF